MAFLRRRDTTNDTAGERPSAASRLVQSFDILLATAAALLAAAAVLYLPAGGPLRLAIVIPVLLLVPGFLLIEAAVGRAASPGRRALRLAVALGASPAVVGLLALSTAIVPGGFRSGVIVAVVTVGCLLMGGLAIYRRSVRPQAAPGTDGPRAAEAVPSEASTSSYEAAPIAVPEPRPAGGLADAASLSPSIEQRADGAP
jgi:uncharacterized membrane protein